MSLISPRPDEPVRINGEAARGKPREEGRGVPALKTESRLDLRQTRGNAREYNITQRTVRRGGGEGERKREKERQRQRQRRREARTESETVTMDRHDGQTDKQTV
eukprot:200417-Rhodomonas_salina.1